MRKSTPNITKIFVNFFISVHLPFSADVSSRQRKYFPRKQKQFFGKVQKGRRKQKSDPRRGESDAEVRRIGARRPENAHLHDKVDKVEYPRADHGEPAQKQRGAANGKREQAQKRRQPDEQKGECRQTESSERPSLFWRQGRFVDQPLRRGGRASEFAQDLFFRKARVRSVVVDFSVIVDDLLPLSLRQGRKVLF